jgi:osmotically-inducible protein OsmY
MGEYEDRYPDASGRSEEAAQPPAREEINQAAPPRQARDRPLVRGRAGFAAAAETAPGWQHAASGRPQTIESTSPGPGPDGSYRGVGPRGYARAPERIYEDTCVRLTDNPFIDACDIDVSVTGTEVTLAGRVDSVVALRLTAAIAWEVPGVSRVLNGLIVGASGTAGAR